MIPYGRQNISEEDIQSVIDVLRSELITQGPITPRFEKAVCDYTGSKYGISVNSGTSALHVACLALELGKNDWLWTSPISFVASANCGLYCGARVDFVDIDPLSWNISIDCLREKLIRAKKKNKLPKILVAVHLCGLPCDMEAIYTLSREYNFHVIEDACHALGGRYKNSPVGNCRYSDITVFSFHPVKNITTGEGGMAVTNDLQFAEKMRLLRNHGITRNPELLPLEQDGSWHYQQIDLGYNYRLTDFQAALGISQLKRLDEFVSKRHKVAQRYDELLSDIPVQLPIRDSESYSGMHLYVICLELEKIKINHRAVFDGLRKNGVNVNIHYIPIYRQPYYKNFITDQFIQSEKYYSRAITLPMYPDLSLIDQDKVISALKKVLHLS
ncbi:UDP-4-amino-4,6-dideoxy-N-acetyl-beta-L-altrosamine transaminase [Thermodesulfobacteriota bacterium]